MTTIHTTDETAVVEHGAIATVTRLRARLLILLASHTTVDVYAAFTAPILGLLEIRCDLQRWQTATLLGIGPISSGLSQPLTAWLSDRFDSRIFAPLGLALAAICLSCIGLANSFATLLGLYIGGTIGVGMFHPVAASSMGHLAEQFNSKRRALGVSIFFVAGMIGGTSGALLSPWIAARPGGFDTLRWLLIPGVLVSLFLLAAIRRAPHRDHVHHTHSHVARTIAARWRMIVVLYISNALRFTVNIALIYLFVRWTQALVRGAHPGLVEQDVARLAAPLAGRLNAILAVGMAIGGLAAGSLVRHGRERGPMMMIPLLAAPLIALFPFVNPALGYLLAACAGIGFAATVPVTISLSQRLLPHRTSLASGLMMGAAWAVSSTGPVLVEWILTLTDWGLTGAFLVVACLLAVAGLVCTLLDNALLHESAASRL